MSDLDDSYGREFGLEDEEESVSKDKSSNS